MNQADTAWMLVSTALVLLFMCYQGTFCIITSALISGAIVERLRFPAYVASISLWAVLVYSPIAHWMRSAQGRRLSWAWLPSRPRPASSDR